MSFPHPSTARGVARCEACSFTSQSAWPCHRASSRLAAATHGAEPPVSAWAGPRAAAQPGQRSRGGHQCLDAGPDLRPRRLRLQHGRRFRGLPELAVLSAQQQASHARVAACAAAGGCQHQACGAASACRHASDVGSSRVGMGPSSSISGISGAPPRPLQALRLHLQTRQLPGGCGVQVLPPLRARGQQAPQEAEEAGHQRHQTVPECCREDRLGPLGYGGEIRALCCVPRKLSLIRGGAHSMWPANGDRALFV
mmetsp:Transcript_62678/g.173740  ORF Transcript_62678/g.173740 Transcript_62678/m.173740 type:complete len:254 (-) Transcript_62678:127-888(-)